MLFNKYTGKPINKLSDLISKPNGHKCDYCGAETIDNCPRCGAPQCCPKCCEEGHVRELKISKIRH